MGSRFLDSFTPHVTQGAGSNGLSSVMTMPGMRSSLNSLGKEQEQLASYELWNYVAINRIVVKASELHPLFGVSVKSEKGQKQYLSRKQREHVKQSYRGVLQSEDYDLQPIPDSNPLVKLFQKPNESDWWETLAYETHLFWQLCGQFYWWVVPNGIGLPAAIYVIPNDWIKPRWSHAGALDHWVITPEGRAEQFKVPVDQIEVCQFKNPKSKFSGYSPSEAGAIWIDNTKSIEQSRWHSFKNSINPSMILKLGDGYSKNIEKDEIKRIKERVMHRLEGVNNTGEPMLLPPQVEMEKLHYAPKELDFSKSTDSVRDAVFALRGVPKVLAGVTTDLNRSVVETAYLIFCETTINPLNRLLAGFVTHRIAVKFDPRIVCYFEDCSPGNWDRELKEDELDSRIGALSPDEQRLKRNRDPLNTPASQTTYISSSLIPLDEKLAVDDLDGDDETEDSPEPDPDEDDDDTDDE